MGFFKSVRARQIFDSRGNPTVEVTIATDKGTFVAGVPSGASTGSNEAHELRDEDTAVYNGKGVSKAVAAVNEVLGPALTGSALKPDDQAGIDRLLIDLDGTKNKTRLGANAILGVSMAACRAGAAHNGIELFQHIGQLCDPNRPIDRPYVLPVPCTNQLNGGVHSGNGLAPQEFMLLPTGAKDFEDAMRIVTECYHSLKDVITRRFGRQGRALADSAGTGVGDEGGFAPPIRTPEEALDLLVEATAAAGHTSAVHFAIDPASSEFYNADSAEYDLDFKSGSDIEHRKLNSKQLGDLYRSLLEKYPIVLLEDPFAEDDWDSWTAFMRSIKGKVELVGDDLLCTNTSIVRKAVDKKACDSMLLKINQVGSITEALEATVLAYKSGWSVFVSHRSGETIDDFIADLVVGVQSGHIKSGAPCRGERLAKYNRLLQIEKILETHGIPHSYAGSDFRNTHRLE